MTQPSNFDTSGIVRPFMRWVGGKQKMIGQLMDRLPPRKSYTSYYEPFLGAGSLFLSGGFANAHLTDLNAHLINAYEHIKHSPELLWCELERYRYNLELWKGEYYYQIRDAYNNHLQDTNLAQGARFIFLVHNNFRGLFRVNKSGKYNVPYGHQKRPQIPSLEHLIQVSERLRHAELEYCSYEEALEGVGEGALIYLDPPYPTSPKTPSFTGYTTHDFREEDQRRLANLARECSQRGAKIMVSISDTELTRELYALGWKWYRTDLKRNLNPRTEPITVGELILTNYDPAK